MSTNRKRLVCPNCGTEMPTFANYCKYCGTALDNEQNVNTGSENEQNDTFYGCIGLIIICLIISGVWYIWSSINSSDSSTYTTQQYIKTSGYSSITFKDNSDFYNYLCSHRFVEPTTGDVIVFEKRGVDYSSGYNLYYVKGYMNGILLGTGYVGIDVFNPTEGSLTLEQNRYLVSFDVSVSGSHYLQDKKSKDRYYEQ